MADPYSTLGLARGASADEAKNAFHKLAKTCHPDLHPNDARAESRFKEINAAYDEIVNPPPPQPQMHSNPFNNFRFNFDPGNIHGGRSPFDDLFGQLHAQQRHDLVYEARLSLEDVFTGKELTLQVPPQQNGGAMREFKVTVPPGTDDGMRLVVQQGGNQFQPGTRPTDLHIIIRIIPHARFTRSGMNLVTTVPATVFDVLLGNDLEVMGIDGIGLRVTVPSGFDSARKLRLAGQGMADAHGRRGDLLVDLFVYYPPIPADQQAILRQVAEAVAAHS